MSRIGKLPISVPDNVKVEINQLNIKISGSLGVMEKSFKGEISLKFQDNKIFVNPLNIDNPEKFARAMWGTARSIINNMIKGVTVGFSTELEINGVGYRANVAGKYLNLALGKSHNTKVEIPANIKVDVPKPTSVLLKTIDKESLGQFVYLIKKQRPPEPYKGKGIKIAGEYIIRKQGKKGK